MPGSKRILCTNDGGLEKSPGECYESQSKKDLLMDLY